MRSIMMVGVCLLAGATLAGCQNSGFLAAPVAADDPSGNIPIAASSETVLIAAAKLVDLDGKIMGQVEFYDRGDALIVTGAASGMNPALGYASAVHTAASGCGEVTADTVKLGEWRVDKSGVGRIKVLIPTLTRTTLRSYATVSLMEEAPSPGVTPEVIACGQIRFR